MTDAIVYYAMLRYAMSMLWYRLIDGTMITYDTAAAGLAWLGLVSCLSSVCLAGRLAGWLAVSGGRRLSVVASMDFGVKYQG